MLWLLLNEYHFNINCVPILRTSPRRHTKDSTSPRWQKAKLPIMPVKRKLQLQACQKVFKNLNGSSKIQSSISLSPTVKAKCCYYGTARYMRLLKRQSSSLISHSSVEKLAAVPVTRSQCRKMKEMCFYELSWEKNISEDKPVKS